MNLYHVTSYADVLTEDSFILRPGTQNAEGVGVYFSESQPRLTAAEGAQRLGITAIICIHADDDDGWWQSKGAKAKKFGKPRTWHTANKSLRCVVVQRGEHHAYLRIAPLLEDSWREKHHAEWNAYDEHVIENHDARTTIPTSDRRPPSTDQYECTDYGDGVWVVEYK